jgi:hypothetical protein
MNTIHILETEDSESMEVAAFTLIGAMIWISAILACGDKIHAC